MLKFFVYDEKNNEMVPLQTFLKTHKDVDEEKEEQKEVYEEEALKSSEYGKGYKAGDILKLADGTVVKVMSDEDYIPEKHILGVCKSRFSITTSPFSSQEVFQS